MTHLSRLAALALCFLLVSAGSGYGQTLPASLPLFSMSDLQYEGAFRLPASTYGSSSLNYSEGPLVYNPDNHSIFIVGHSHHQAIAEFAVPSLVNSQTLSDLNMAGAPLQAFSTVLEHTPDGNPQDINRIGGLAYFSEAGGSELLVNGYEYYDAPGNNSHTTLALRDAESVSGSQVDGYFQFQGGAGHTSGWISPIPAEWQSMLGGTYITGQSSGIPIISRTSVGPSAFAFDPSDIVGSNAVPTPISTTKLLDFNLNNPLHSDLSNSSLTNDLWTHLSRAVFGMIVPGTRTYMTLGYSGGHVGGVCYKCVQDNGNLCGGYCAPLSDDYYHYYWLWDLNDLVAVKSGQMNAYDVRPYDYGTFPTPFQNSTRQLGGGTYDPVSGLLYLTVQKGDREQGTYSNPPVVIAYSINAQSAGIAIGAKVFLQGAYDINTGAMRTDLPALPQFPLAQPYHTPPWNYTGTETLTVVPEDVVDWVLIELRDAQDPTQTIDRTAALLMSDGSIRGVNDANPPVMTSVQTGSYYVAIHHRNHLSVMTAQPVALGVTPTVYDFTTAPTQVFGGELHDLGNGLYAQIGGDANTDGKIAYIGQDRDQLVIINALGIDNLAGIISDVYDPADLNMDGRIAYINALRDQRILIEALGSSNLFNILTTGIPN